MKSGSFLLTIFTMATLSHTKLSEGPKAEVAGKAGSKVKVAFKPRYNQKKHKMNKARKPDKNIKNIKAAEAAKAALPMTKEESTPQVRTPLDPLLTPCRPPLDPL